jgi:hypothetical protein
MSEEEKSQQKPVSMYPSDEAIVFEVMNRLHIKSFSTALQHIIREYAEVYAAKNGNGDKPAGKN